MKPYLKAEMLYGLRVLLSIVEDVNSGAVSKEDAFKRLKDVKYVGDLTGNHLFAIAVQRGLIVPREFLTRPVAAKTLCNAVRRWLFNDDPNMTDVRIRKATEMASENLGLCMLGGEHALCESVRATKGHAPGNDAYHKDQDFVWISSDLEEDNPIITELRDGRNIFTRSEEQDRITFQQLMRQDKNKVQHRWWIPKPNRTDCLAHFVKECLANGSNPMEIMHSSARGSLSSCKDEEIAIWKHYVTKKSNKINISLLPKQVHHLHQGASHRGVSEGVSQNEKVKARTMNSRETKRNTNTPIAMKPKVVEVTVDKKETARKREKRNTSTSAATTSKVVKVNLGRIAKNAWKECKGEELPEINPFGDSYSSIGTVWTQSIAVPNKSPVYTTTEYPPSVLDECSIPLPDQEGVAFRTKADAKMALYWWVICTVPSVKSRRKWAQKLLGDDASIATIFEERMTTMWCTLTLSTDGSFWLEYKGRKFLLA
jgi:hypothetical protein